jgi:hypothetical protein
MNTTHSTLVSSVQCPYGQAWSTWNCIIPRLHLFIFLVANLAFTGPNQWSMLRTRLNFFSPSPFISCRTARSAHRCAWCNCYLVISQEIMGAFGCLQASTRLCGCEIRRLFGSRICRARLCVCNEPPLARLLGNVEIDRFCRARLAWCGLLAI